MILNGCEWPLHFHNGARGSCLLLLKCTHSIPTFVQKRLDSTLWPEEVTSASFLNFNQATRLFTWNCIWQVGVPVTFLEKRGLTTPSFWHHGCWKKSRGIFCKRQKTLCHHGGMWRSFYYYRGTMPVQAMAGEALFKKLTTGIFFSMTEVLHLESKF